MQIIYTDRHKLHAPHGVLVNDQPFISEEVPERVELIRAALLTAQLGDFFPAVDYGLAPVLAVHAADFIQYLQTIYANQAAAYQRAMPVIPETFAVRPTRHKSGHVEGRKGYYGFGVGSPILEHTWQAAYWSAQCALTAAERVKSGEKTVYALCRPPGHHAASDMYGGFCYLNNAAIAARALNAKTAILDIDFHHGNGTQEIFYRDPQVLYCSLHADPDQDYPYFWGSAGELGEGPGLGFNQNWPLPKGTGDAAYLQALDQALEKIAGFAPTYLVLSAGLDIAEGDKVGGFQITISGFQEIGRRIAALHLPAVIVQEGGYFLEHLGQNAVALLSPLA